MPRSGERLVIEIKNNRPVELADFTSGLTALADQYRRFAEKSDLVGADGSSGNLYIHEIRTGSIIAELQPLVEQLPMFVGAVASVPEFVRHLSEIYEFFLNGVGPDPERPKQEYQNCAGILNPVARDQGSQMNFYIGQMNGDVNLGYSLNSTEGAAIQHRIANHVAMMRQPSTGRVFQQLFYWYQARDDLQARAGDRGVIENIDPRPRKVRFSSEDTKRQMLEGAIFRQVYVVDVEVGTVNGRANLYTILEVHDVFPKED